MPSKDIQRIIKVGNSLAITVPASVARALNFQRGDRVVLSCVEEGTITVRKVNDKDLHNLRVGVIDFNP